MQMQCLDDDRKFTEREKNAHTPNNFNDCVCTLSK